jgi:hypothetical protein
VSLRVEADVVAATAGFAPQVTSHKSQVTTHKPQTTGHTPPAASPSRMLRLIAIAGLGLACASVVQPQTPGADAATEHASYIVRLGTDTIMAESFSRTQRVIDGVVVERSPIATVIHYVLALDADGHITHFDAAERPAADTAGKANWHAVGRRVGGGFDIVEQDGDRTRHRVLPAPAEAIPAIGRSIGLYEIITGRLRCSGLDSMSVPLLDLDSLTVTRRTVRRLGADTIVIPFVFPRGERARVDSTGRILGVSGLATTFKWITESVDGLDVRAIARSFADRERTGGAFGTLSSRDTARATIDGAHIAINYGRPSKRGRAIFGTLVPWGEVWRMGADLATHLTTDRALALGTLHVPAGTYTLYALPSQADWQLVVNRQTGQSGVVYNQAADLGRVTIHATSVRAPVERLTIAIEQTGTKGGIIKISWDDRVAEAPFSVEPPG